MVLVRLREPLEENLSLIKHHGKTFSPVQAGIFFHRSTEQSQLDIASPVCFETPIIPTNSTHTTYQSIFKSLRTFLYDLNQNCSFKHRILSLTSSYLTFRNFFNLLPNQNYIIANACIVLYFWACRAVLQASLTGRISVQSLSCALHIHMAFFLPIRIKKDKTTRKNTFMREIKSKGASFTSFSLAIGLALVCPIQASANCDFLGHSLFTGHR